MSRIRFLLAGMIALLATPGLAADFVPGIAVHDAGKIADPEATQFFAFYIPAGTLPETVVADIKKNLVQAARTQASLAIIGPDYALNAKILGGVLQSAPEGLLKGARILFVNGGEDVDELGRLAARAGASFRATKYSGS